MKVLGIDLGTGSLGWAVMEWDSENLDQRPAKIVDSGVRIFPEGVKKTETGEKSLASERRVKRHMRRQIDRKARRRKKIFWKLYYFGLLPQTNPLSKERPEYFAELDKDLFSEWKLKCERNSNLWHFLKVGAAPNGDLKQTEEFNHRLAIRLPYLIRSVAASEFVSAYSLGRALAQLATRRGFQSNRKIYVKEGANKKEMTELNIRRSFLEERLEKENKTLGQFLAIQEPVEQKLRNIPTTRAMYKKEFDSICRAQQNNPNIKLTKKDWNSLRHLIFFQRPLKSQSHLKNECPLEKKRKCCPKARLISQEYRLRMALLNLKYRDKNQDEFSLTKDQLNTCFDYVWKGEKLNKKSFKKILGLSKYCKWNSDTDGSKSLQAPTVEKIISALGKDESTLTFWNHVNQADFVDEILSYEHSGALLKYLFKKYSNKSFAHKVNLSQIQCENLSTIAFEDGTIAYSAKALHKLLPYLRQWKRIDQPIHVEEGGASIRETLYPEKRVVDQRLRPLKDVVGEVRNPVVTRSLGQLRAVVNAIILKHDLPDLIRVELAREIKKTSKEREKIWRENLQREKNRADISNILTTQLTEFKNKLPKHYDIEKYLLWLECGKQCPYTGKIISVTFLFGNEYQVEHIIPLSRGSLEDTYANKTLCHVSANKRKGNKTPFEAFSSNKDEWDGILDRISKWPTSKEVPFLSGYSWGREEKLRRFKNQKSPCVDDFIARQLIDTQYSTKLARKYLTSLYEKLECVQVSNGTLTAVLRKITGINGLLGEKENGGKSRDDHRHHVIDAMMVAISTPARVKALSDLVGKSEIAGERPWKNLQKNLQECKNMMIEEISKTRISFAARTRARGSFHKDNQYGIALIQGEMKAVINKSLDPQQIPDQKSIENILDTNLKNHFLENKIKIKELFDIENSKFEILIGPNGKPLRKLKMIDKELEKKLKVKNKYNKNETKYLDNDENHHFEIWSAADKKGHIKWQGRVMNMLEACILKSKKQSRYKTLGKTGEIFVMTLHKNDLVEITKGEKVGIWRVDGIDTKGQISLQRLHDAMTRNNAKKVKNLWSPKAKGLQEGNAKRIFVDVLGYPIVKKEPDA